MTSNLRNILHWRNQCFSNLIMQSSKSFRRQCSGWIFTPHSSLSLPKFKVHGSNVEVLFTPTEFYDKLKVLSENAQKRIAISSLYLGSGEMEKQLVKCWHQAASNNKDLKIDVLLDYSRGSRGEENSRTMLLPLVKSFPVSANVYLYHTPYLRNLYKFVLPSRWNEIVGLNHMKIYLFDDSIILSGANMSELYFKQRQDRYVLIRDSKPLADYFYGLLKTVAKFSFQMQSDNSIQLDESWPHHPFEGNLKDFKNNAKKNVLEFIDQQVSLAENCSDCEDADTFIYPQVQMGELEINQDLASTDHLLDMLPIDTKVYFTTGYFNLHPIYMDRMISKSLAQYHILMSSPEANGFFGASGLSNAIPIAYNNLAYRFFRRAEELKLIQSERINLYEFYKAQWTFHAKGLWIYDVNSRLPSFTLVGSPNFGYRSVQRDLECQVGIFTTNENLQRKLHKEKELLFKYSEKTDYGTYSQDDRQVPLWVMLVTYFFPTLF